MLRPSSQLSVANRFARLAQVNFRAETPQVKRSAKS
jgi:hypothetical protein